jgi:hypothetical protein
MLIISLRRGNNYHFYSLHMMLIHDAIVTIWPCFIPYYESFPNHSLFFHFAPADGGARARRRRYYSAKSFIEEEVVQQKRNSTCIELEAQAAITHGHSRAHMVK